jgi:hypothetical protein
MRPEHVRQRVPGLPLAGAALVLGIASSVHAFCRTTTCDLKHEDCPLDEHGCMTTGRPLFWADACFSVWTPSDPQPLPGIDARTFATLAQTAFDTWRDADCAPGTPALEAHVASAPECNSPDYDKYAPDGFSTISVVSDVWLGNPNDIALTTVGFVPSSGEIRGFTMELNAAQRMFTTSDRIISSDLLSALTHEAGHTLGFGHSDVATATMFPTTGPSIALRTLDVDDERAICSVYPPDPDQRAACAGERNTIDEKSACDAIAGRAAALTRPPAGCNCDVARMATNGSRPWPASLASLATLAYVCIRRRPARRCTARAQLKRC